jgi:hypothetical protein
MDFYLEALLPKKLKKMKVLELFVFKMFKRIAGLENLNDSGENIRENIKVSGIEFRPL